ncbi:transcription-repair coupling factor [Notoacmeibacter sp. MSK16QG-6]|uniref:transcription-repair coupling factor n=1 Tax=Notoacmeibacter sp. MSK16QG-6 TaxID=2957982 RepID=UPI0020A0B1F2|nr:transcription-repair coupling factor [Notoacmeibacter sp. MSK16QG-6]MCP1200733.1 transcription-repair coupling factor [Notoacmeibacter sp. MSK16QG-6]
MTILSNIQLPAGTAPVIADGVSDDYEPFALTRLIAAAGKRPILFIARDGNRLPDFENTLRFAAPKTRIVTLPAWDCLPYDRVSPGADAAARRLDALGALTNLAQGGESAIILASANAVLQRFPPSSVLAEQIFHARPGATLEMDTLVRRLEADGFERVATVREVGEYAVRGGILDLFVPGAKEPVRLDFFGDELETVRSFDPATQRTSKQLDRFTMQPVSEVTLTSDAIARFRRGYIEAFGAPRRDDVLYQSISEGRRFAGMEHWLPLFYEGMDTVFDLLPEAMVVFDHLAAEALEEREKQIVDHFESRKNSGAETAGQSAPYHPLPPGRLYMTLTEVEERCSARERIDLTPFDQPFTEGRRIAHGGARRGRNFAEERAQPDTNVFDAAVKHLATLRGQSKRLIVAAWSDGSLDRLSGILAEHGLGGTKPVASLEAAMRLEGQTIGLAVLPIENGFESDDLSIVAEQDLLGDRLVRRSRRKGKAADFISELSSLSTGDLVVHSEHGIGRFVGLKTIEAAGAPHDCLELHYASDGRLFLPVENIELLSRYGGEGTDAALDRLGGGAWQARKAKLKKRLLDMADKLIRIAAEREMKSAPRLTPPEGIYGEFAARFPYEETEDQQMAIDAVLDDLSSGRAMDRLICGDVGFGKTEVALRGAFAAVMEGFQVAVVVPTTLLARQHFRTFSQRFAGLPVTVRQASRLVGGKELAATKKGLTDGNVDIVVGTHALLGSSVKFKRLGLLIIDEEQHFGVKHKERLKELRSDVHVLTLSATPIPRTLQLALSGVRELSLITTAPVDRMAVRTFISPFDAMVVRETLLRERYRGGQSFYVVPRISDLGEVKQFLDEHVPELKVAVAHGQMPPTELDDVMNAFYDGQYDVLLSTTIVESGLDVPTANTLVVHRADMFGLAQLYQIRGRVGRSKQRAYALLTLPVRKKLTVQAERRLKVLQSLDTLGAGFQLASHDLDLRGAGNLLGEEQSGHIREVGYELYQQMLEEAVAEIRGEEDAGSGSWSPQITIGTAVLIPEGYVPDLNLRLSLYRRLAELTEPQDIDGFGAELIDRFGPLPDEVQHLLKVVYIKALCRKANVEKLEAGPKGVVISFRNQEFANPAALVQHIGRQGAMAKLRPDQSIVFVRDLPTPEKRLSGSAVIMAQLAKMAEGDAEAA